MGHAGDDEVVTGRKAVMRSLSSKNVDSGEGATRRRRCMRRPKDECPSGRDSDLVPVCVRQAAPSRLALLRRHSERETVEATLIECTAPLAGCMLHFDGLNTSDKLSTASRSRSSLCSKIVWGSSLAGFDTTSRFAQRLLNRRKQAKPGPCLARVCP